MSPSSGRSEGMEVGSALTGRRLLRVAIVGAGDQSDGVRTAGELSEVMLTSILRAGHPIRWG